MNSINITDNQNNMDSKYCKFPRWKPELWNVNIPEDVKDYTNCYSYALNRLEFNIDGKLQPGELSGDKYDFMDCDVIFENIKRDLNREDVYKTTYNSKMNCFQHKIALALDIKSDDQDYHFYRLDNNGKWSHKPGSSSATNLDASNNIIINPQKADRDYSYKEYEDDDGNIERGKNYELFCGFYAIPDNKAPILFNWDENQIGGNIIPLKEDTYNLNYFINSNLESD